MFDQLSGVVTALQGVDVDRLSDDDVLDAVQALEVQRRRLATVEHALTAQVERRGLARSRGCRDTGALLVGLLRISPLEARGRVGAAELFGPRVGLAGEPLPRLLPAVAAEIADGSLSGHQARVIAETVEALPAAVEAEHGAAVEALLVEQAGVLNPTLLAKVGQRILATLNPDGVLTSEADHERRRGLGVRVNPDGSAELAGHLSPWCVATWQPIFDSLARPAPATTEGAGAGSEVAGPDPRSHAQRMHDAFLDAGQRLLRTADLPDTAGVPVTILATMTVEQLEARTGVAVTGHDTPISVQTLLKHAADAQLVPVVFGQARDIRAFAGPHRLARPAERLALAARDGGCTFPGCDAPVQWCQAHHVPDFQLTGRTRVDELALVCGFHHREHERQGWHCRMINGRPHWIPPAWLDHDQTPRTNHAHHATWHDYLTRGSPENGSPGDTDRDSRSLNPRTDDRDLVPT